MHIESGKRNVLQAKLDIGTVVSVGLKGIFRVEGIEDLACAGSRSQCYALTQLNSKAIHKTFVVVNRLEKEGVRVVASVNQINDLESIIFDENFELADIKLNSMKKISFYDDVCRSDGLLGMVKAYLAIQQEFIKVGREEKRMKAYADRLRASIIAEISFVQDILPIEASGKVDRLVSLFAN